MMVLFIPWDIWFTINEVWWFNSDYTVGLKIFNLPIEEWLFFICIPFACVFIYEVISHFIKPKISQNIPRFLFFLLAVFLLVTSFIYMDRIYTSINFRDVF